MTVDEAMAAAVDAHLEAVMDAMQPWDAGSAYLNFVEKREDAARFYPGATYERLRAIKAAYDPHDVFRANHPVRPLTRELRPTGRARQLRTLRRLRRAAAAPGA
jgi:FAD/FMN-containing dehydrogenase